MKEVLDFIVIGAQKGGTTSLFEYLSRHPALSLPPSKEAPYFARETRYGQDWTEYLRKTFPFADPQCKWGKVTPQYMYGGMYGPVVPQPNDVRSVPRRIHERLPDVRLIAVLRDPVQRARSHHAMEVLEGWETRSFDQAVDELLQPEALLTSRRRPREITGYIVFGEYGRILRGYLDVFPREQLLVLFTKDLQDDPRSVVRQIFEFLGVDARFVPDNLSIRYRESGTARRFTWLDPYRFQAAASSNPLLRRAWRALPERARRRAGAQYIQMNYRVGLWNRRRSDRREVPLDTEGHAATDRMLREHFESDARILAELFGVRPPWSPAHGSTIAQASLSA